jgi:hypothetical protein
MSNGNLILHVGGYHCERDAVYNVATPAAVGGHHPIPHAALLEQVEKHIASSGYGIKQAAFGLHDRPDPHAKGEIIPGSNFFGLLELDAREDGYGLCIGLRNSHNAQFAASIAIGSRVFVCDNLAFSGEVKIARKHTVHITRDLPQCVSAAVGRITDQRVAQAQRIEAYKRTVLSVEKADHLLIEFLRNRAVNASDIGKVLAEYDNPSHPEHLGVDGQHTVWTLFNAVTEASTKHTNVWQLGRRTQALHGVCDSAAGVLSGQRQLAAALDDVEDVEFEALAA